MARSLRKLRRALMRLLAGLKELPFVVSVSMNQSFIRRNFAIARTLYAISLLNLLEAALDQEQFNYFMYNYERQKAIATHQTIAALNNKELAQQPITKQGSEPSEIAAIVLEHFWIFDDLVSKKNKVEFIRRLRQLLPC
jgi:hypothetical protein